MRLIDADKLKKCAIPCEIHNGVLTDLCVPLYQIDNAPTVNTTCPHCDSGYAQGLSDGYLRGKEDRPQGAWEEPFENNGKTYHKCNRCHISSELIFIDKFCPNCGAEMKGGAE